MADLRRARTILPRPDYEDDPARTLRLLQRLDRENNVLPLESWTECFRRGPASSPDQVVPGLFLGNLKTAAQYLLGGPHGDCKITHILSIVQTSDTVRYNLPEAQGAGTSLKRLILNRRDTKTENILRDFDRTSEFIHEAVELYRSSGGEQGGILVHRFAGISRSASLVIAYLLKYPQSLPPLVALMMSERVHDTGTFVQSRRNVVSPNIGFRKQLELYYYALNCSLTDGLTGRIKKPYMRWIQQRACNNSREVVSTILKYEWQRREKDQENHVRQDFAI